MTSTTTTGRSARVRRVLIPAGVGAVLVAGGLALPGAAQAAGGVTVSETAPTTVTNTNLPSYGELDLTNTSATAYGATAAANGNPASRYDIALTLASTSSTSTGLSAGNGTEAAAAGPPATPASNVTFRISAAGATATTAATVAPTKYVSNGTGSVTAYFQGVALPAQTADQHYVFSVAVNNVNVTGSASVTSAYVLDTDPTTAALATSPNAPDTYSTVSSSTASTIAIQGPAAVTIPAQTIPSPATGGDYYYRVITTGAPYPSFSATNLPGGLTIDPITGVISGVPTGSTSTSATVITATNAFGGNTYTATLSFSPTVGFSDLAATSTFGTAVYALAGDGIINGYADGTFRGGDVVTRQAFAAFLTRLITGGDVAFPNTTTTTTGTGTTTTGQSTPDFSDVPTTATFAGDIHYLTSHGIITGYGDGTFKPGNVVTRQAAAAFIDRAYDFVFSGTNGVSVAAPTNTQFTDVNSTNPYSGAIQYLATNKIASGYSDGTFRPTLGVSRQATAQFLYTFAKLYPSRFPNV